MKRRILSVVLIAGLATAARAAELAHATWWWHGPDANSPETYSEKLEFLASNGVDEVFFCVDPKTETKALGAFVRALRQRGMRVSWLAGDVSWIYPGKLGFDETYQRFIAYQRQAPADERFDAFHLDVEPHADRQLTDTRKWQLYADLVMRATATAHRDGERIEWDIPFWLDNLRVDYGSRTNAPLLDVVMDNSDGVCLMSYRDTAAAMLDTGKTELAMAAGRRCRVLLGAETGETGEGDFVSYYEEGKARMREQLDLVLQALGKSKLPTGGGVAVHHVGSWMKLKP